MNHKDFFNILVQEFARSIDNDYILLDLPYYANVGDVLIWQSTLDVLKKLPFKCLYSSSIETYSKPQISERTIILFLGGGNFGDLWIRHQMFRQKVLKDFPKNKIIQLPQSALFNDECFLKEDVDLFRSHKAPIVFFARERKTFDFFEKNYPFVENRLVPDMVLSFDVLSFCKKHSISLCKGQGTLLVNRNDSEKNNVPIEIVSPYDIGDWPCMNMPIFEERLYGRTVKIASVLGVKFKNWYSNYFFKKILKKRYISSGVQFLNKYETVYSTRLHSAILAWLLGKNVYVIDNSYGKCKGIFNEWLKNEQNVVML